MGVLLSSHFKKNCIFQFLPVHVPNEEEKADPFLFANKVRNKMAR